MENESKNVNVQGFGLCASFEAELPAYLEGEERPQLVAHAEHCDFCRCVLADVQQIRMLGSEVGLEDPPASIWTGVRSALIAEGVIKLSPGARPRWGWRMFRAPLPAGILAAAALAIVLFKAPGYLVQRHQASSPTIHASLTREYMGREDVTQLQRTIEQLELAYRANEALLEPSMKMTYQTGLASLNDEIRECQTSVEQDPENRMARQYLSSAYAQKAELLQSALEFNLH